MKKMMENYFNEFKRMMRLDIYDISFEYKDDEKGMQDKYAVMETIIHPDYYTAHIIVNMEKVEEQQKTFGDKEIIGYIVHELAHIITQPLYNQAINGCTNAMAPNLEILREQATEHIARIFLRSINVFDYPLPKPTGDIIKKAVTDGTSS